MRIALILPYFGKFDKLFPLWLESCKYNPDIDWIIFTDDRTCYDYPVNVKVHYTDFEELRQKFQKHYDFELSLEKPYRLCNFKPAYGDLFQEYLEGYDAWGFCDNDMVYGNIIKLLPKSDEEKYKYGKFGHLTIMPNTPECRTLYRYADAYKVAFSTPQPLFFDENSFTKILLKHGYVEYPLHIADFMPRLKQFKVLNEEGNEWKNRAHCFVWQNGVLMRYYVGMDGNIEKEEYAYVHFLKRPMDVEENIDFKKPIVIIPNRIFNMPIEEITSTFLRKVSAQGIFWSYWRNSFKPRNLLERLRNRLYQNKQNSRLIDNMNMMIDNSTDKM